MHNQGYENDMKKMKLKLLYFFGTLLGFWLIFDFLIYRLLYPRKYVLTDERNGVMYVADDKDSF